MRIVLLQGVLDRRLRRGKAQRLAECAHDRFGFVGRLPLAVDRREAARIKRALALLISNFKEVLAKIGVVETLAQIAVPRQGLGHNVVYPEYLLLLVTCVG